MSYLILTGMVLIELLLIGGGFLLFRRFARKRCAARVAQAGADSHADRLMAFLDFEIQRMQGACADFAEGDPTRQAIERRLTVFSAERNILSESRNGNELDNSGYATLVERYYRSADLARTPEFDKLQTAVSTYQQRIDNLEQFRTLFFRSQKDLADAANRVVDMKRRLEEGMLNEDEQAALIAQLKQEKERLGKELNIADHELEAIMSNMGQLQKIDLDGGLPDKGEIKGILDQMRAIEEENEFLQVQIQHLLKAEVDSENELKGKLEAMQAALDEADERYRTLEAKFLEMEAHYLQLVG